MKPVYIINGFLGSGKTDFFRYTMAQPYFQTKGRTLLIVCEEGENEYEEALLKKTNTVMEVIEDEEDFTVSKLMAFENKYDPERILIEFNGMWNFKNVHLPKKWTLEQQITMIDASLFQLYYTNMKSLLAEQIRGSELILFNRCDGIEDLPAYKRNIKAINQKADIIFEDKNGEVDVTLDEDLPFDVNANPIVLDDYGYGMFYIDALDHVDRYLGKQVKFKAMVMKPDDFPSTMFVPGRMVMGCCANDMQFLGYACDYKGAEALHEKQWVEVTAEVERKYLEEYEGEGPFLKAVSVEETEAPKEAVIDLTGSPQ